MQSNSHNKQPSMIMNYIGMTATTFKERLANHNYTFESIKSTQTKLNFRNIFGRGR